MKRATKLRLISFLMVIVMMTVTLPVVALEAETAAVDSTMTPAVSEEIESTEVVETTEEAPTVHSLLGVGEKTYEELQSMRVEDVARPEGVSLQAALEKGHVNRLYAQEEDLNTVIYQNRDGSKSTYIFAKPVKYIDETGAVRDKSTSVALQSDESYAMLENSTRAYFPKNLLQGVTVAYGDYRINMKPISLTTAANVSVQDGKLVYGSAFGLGTALMYQTGLNGVKEDIVLSRNVGKYSFSFGLTLTGGLTPALVDGVWVLQDVEGNTVADLGRVIVKDSAGRKMLGEMTIVRSGANAYTLTVNVPQEFLTDSNTTYPVYIDPTVTIYEMMTSLDGWDVVPVILDTGIYGSSGLAQSALNDTDFHWLGADAGYYGAILYRFTDFFATDGRYKNLTADEIGSATFYFTTEYTEALSIQVLSMDDTYDGTAAAIYDSAGLLEFNSSTAYGSTGSISATSGLKSINVTAMVKAWANFNADDATSSEYPDPYHGFLLYAESYGYEGCEVYSTDSLTGSTYLVLDTSNWVGTYYLNNKSTGKFLIGDEDYLYESTHQGSDTQKFLIKYLGDNEYVIQLQGGSGYYLSSEDIDDENLVVSTYSASSDEIRWNIAATTGGLIITNVANGNVLRSTGNRLYLSNPLSSSEARYNQTIWRICRPSAYVPLADFMLEENWLLEDEQKQMVPITVPGNASQIDIDDFTWVSSNTALPISEDGIVGPGTTPTTAILTVTHKPTGISKTIAVFCDVNPENTHYIRNVEHGQYLSQDNRGETFAETSPLYYFDQPEFDCRWVFTASNGYLTIRKYGSTSVLTAPATAQEEAIVEILPFNSSLGDRQLWAFIQQTDGSYSMKSKAWEGTDFVLGFTSAPTFVKAAVRTQSQVTDRTTKWNYYSISNCNKVNLTVLYDYGYYDRYGEAVLYNILNHMKTLQELYLLEFGVFVNYSTPEMFYSYVDTECTLSSTGLCTHATDTQCQNSSVNDLKAYHHTNINNVLYRIPRPNTAKSLTMAYLGHDYCKIDDDGEHDEIMGTNGLAVRSIGVAIVMHHTTFLSRATMTTIHEFGHFYTSNDHYGLGQLTTEQIIAKHGDLGFAEDCIYGENKENFKTEICDGCKTLISQNIDLYDHE